MKKLFLFSALWIISNSLIAQENERADTLRKPFDTLNQDFQRDVDFNGRFKYNGRLGRIQLAYTSRVLSYTSASGQKEYTAGGGLMLSAKLQISKKGNLYFTGITGKGIARYLGGLEGKGEDAFPNAMGGLDLLQLWSSTFGVRHYTVL